MNSTEKVWTIVEQLQDSEDSEIAEALPLGLPAPILRGALLMITDQIPQDPAALDEFLSQVGDFCHSLRSDGYERAA